MEKYEYNKERERWGMMPIVNYISLDEYLEMDKYGFTDYKEYRRFCDNLPDEVCQGCGAYITNQCPKCSKL